MRRRWLLAAAAGLLALQCAATGLAWDVVAGLYAWAAICAICGYAKTYLNRPSTLLTHLNEAVLPVYVLHQPILLMAAFWIFPLGLPAAAEGTLLAAITGVGSLAIYEALIRPFAVTRFLFGLRAEGRPRAQLKAAKHLLRPLKATSTFHP